jgi:hypothetical protein
LHILPVKQKAEIKMKTDSSCSNSLQSGCEHFGNCPALRPAR